jgi:hypothetical protein
MYFNLKVEFSNEEFEKRQKKNHRGDSWLIKAIEIFISVAALGVALASYLR